MLKNVATCAASLLLLLSGGCGDSSSPKADAAIDPGAADANPNAPDANPNAPDADTEADAEPPPTGAPTWSNEMTSAGAGEFYTRAQQGGTVERNLADSAASDGFVARLKLPGNPALGPADHVSPEFASELGTNASFSYGTYRMRVELGSCAAGEEAVNGLFTYFNDGTDHDGDGITDNSEIDIEVLCGTPRVAFLTVWTDYDGATDTFRKLTRAIDFSNGDLWDSPNDHEYGLDKVGNDPTLAQPTLLDPGHFVELGFEWHADRVRYFATIGGVEKTLWDLHDAAHVPHLPGAIMFNIWHPGEHWFGGGGAPDYPAHDATLTVDWIKYWAE
jgi:hypothetical protein